MSVARPREAAASLGQRLTRKLRVSHKVLLGAGLLLTPTVALLHYYTATADTAIESAIHERCGLKVDALYRRLLEQEVEGAPRALRHETVAALRALESEPCGTGTFATTLKLAGIADELDRRIAAGIEPLAPTLLDRRSALGDASGLVLDPALDTYYVADFLVDRVAEGIELLSATGPVDRTRLQLHTDHLRRDLAAAEDSNESGDTRDPLRNAIAQPRADYLAALQGVETADGKAAALQALFLFADAAAAWEDRALQARIDERERRKVQTYGIVVAVLLLAGIFAWLTVRDSVHRLRDLVRMSKRIGRGNLEVTTVAGGNDELAELQGTFGTMAGKLRQSHEELERRVAERTAAAQAAEERFRMVVEAAPEAFVLTDATGRITLVNSQAENLFGYAREEMIGQPVERLVPAGLREQHAKDRSGFNLHPSSRPMGASRRLCALRKDGSEVPVEIGLSVMQTPDGPAVLAGVIDISPRIAAETLAREVEANALRVAILQGLPASVIATDVAGTIVSVNPAAERLLGYPAQDLVGRPSILIHDPDELQRHAAELSRLVGQTVRPGFDVVVTLAEGNQADRQEWTLVRKDGSRVPVQIAITALHDDSGRISGFLQVARDIAAHKQAEEQVRHMARHDALTGLPNRALLLDRLGATMHQSRRHDRKIAVLIMDIDRFKQINDSLGHQAGDQVLMAIAERLERTVCNGDTVCRLGGDEFVVLVPDVASREEIGPRIAAIFAAVSEPLRVGHSDLQVTPTLGAALFPDDGTDATTLLMKADTAMYQAKRARGGRSVLWFADSMLQESQETFALGTALRNALDNEELAVHYQPEVSLRTGQVIGMEALLRWEHNGKSVSPARFIPIAEDSGLILALGEWVLRKACFDCVRLQGERGRRLRVAVNVSPIQFQKQDWLDIVTSALADSHLHPSQLELEITETALMQDPEGTVSVLRALRKLGVGVVIDDFGTGYSSLAYVTRFPIDKIKIDRSFVRNLATSVADAAVVNAIIAMARRLGVQIVAEGVETPELRDYLQSQGCDEAQGFLYSPALPLPALAERLAAIEAAARRTPDPSGLVTSG